jgi:molybdopterin-containing oxidoreductase family membrane subunit
MWLERFVIIPMSLHRDYLPSSWGMYVPTFWDFLLFGGTIGFFVFLMWMFVRFLPAINMFEMKDLLFRLKHQHAGHVSTEPKPEGDPADVH